MKNSLYILLAGTLWGCTALLIGVLQAAGFTSLQCVALRAFFTALLLFLFLLLTGRDKLRIHLRDVPYFFGTGILSIAFFNYCYFEAIDRMGSAAVPALLLYTAPVFVMFLSALLFREQFTPAKGIATGLTLVGLGFITGAFSGGETLSGSVILLGLGAGLGYALYSIFGKCVAAKYDACTITFYTFAIAAVGVVPISGITRQLPVLLSPGRLLAALGLALFCTVLPFLLYTYGLRGMEAGKAAILATVEPLVAAIVGALFFHEQFTLSKLLGMVLILFAIVYLNAAPAIRRQPGRER